MFLALMNIIWPFWFGTVVLASISKIWVIFYKSSGHPDAESYVELTRSHVLLKGRLSTVDLLVLTSLDQLLLILKIIFILISKAALFRRSTVLSLPPQLAFPGCNLHKY